MGFNDSGPAVCRTGFGWMGSMFTVPGALPRGSLITELLRAGNPGRLIGAMDIKRPVLVWIVMGLVWDWKIKLNDYLTCFFWKAKPVNKVKKSGDTISNKMYYKNEKFKNCVTRPFSLVKVTYNKTPLKCRRGLFTTFTFCNNMGSYSLRLNTRIHMLTLCAQNCALTSC